MNEQTNILDMSASLIGEPIPEPASSAVEQTPEPVPPVTETSCQDALPFFGTRPVKILLEREAPHHRFVLNLLVQGYTQTEIMEQTGFTLQTIAKLRDQPWAQEYIAIEQAKNGKRVVDGILRGGQVEAAKYLVDVATGKVPARSDLRAKEANNLLNRLFGTAPQVVMHGKVNPRDLTDEELASVIRSETASA